MSQWLHLKLLESFYSCSQSSSSLVSSAIDTTKSGRIDQRSMLGTERNNLTLQLFL